LLRNFPGKSGRRPACPIAAGSWEAIKRSADAAAEAAMLVRDGMSWVYALSRPPGHHAFADMAGGFCYVNNSGVAAQLLRSKYDRVAILDVDVHHGNGTQGMFYKRADILTVSIHADPVRFYPFFWGHADERGEGAGLGYNYNLPLPRGTDDDAYMPALETAFRRIEAFAPGALVVALGLDAFKDDPQGGFAITTGGFERIGEAIGRLSLPTVLVQEGGYLCDGLGPNLTSFLQGFGAGHAG
jgi:acetoin utilization deacetylase AcuC-like enzyme